jgi:hypothetical protein
MTLVVPLRIRGFLTVCPSAGTASRIDLTGIVAVAVGSAVGGTGVDVGAVVGAGLGDSMPGVGVSSPWPCPVAGVAVGIHGRGVGSSPKRTHPTRSGRSATTKSARLDLPIVSPSDPHCGAPWEA